MSKKRKVQHQPQTVAPVEQKRKRFVPELGAPYSFTPAVFLQEKSAMLPGRNPAQREVTGNIIYINWAHSYFTVEYEVNGYNLRQSIKF